MIHSPITVTHCQKKGLSLQKNFGISSGKIKSVMIFLVLCCWIFQTALGQTDPFLKDYAERWETSREYLLAVAEAMPESDYHYKPTSEEMSFAEQLMHIAVIIDWHCFAKTDGQEYRPRYEEFNPEGLSKKEMIAISDREFDRAAKMMADFEPARLEETGEYGKFTRTRRQFFLLMTDHVTHHRGQMIVYLRLKGIIPPNYIDYQ